MLFTEQRRFLHKEQVVVEQESVNVKDCFHLSYSPLDFSVCVSCMLWLHTYTPS